MESKNETLCDACLAKAAKFKRKRKVYFFSISFLLKYILLFLGWITVSLLSTTILTTSTNIKIWNPFKILDVTPYSSLNHIKHQFKILSRRLHPDKYQNAFKQNAEKIFIDVTKAYKVYYFQT